MIMVDKIFVIKTSQTNPYHNLALEEALLKNVGQGECILYLWQNRQTVVIGRNQSASDECNIQKLEADGGFLARRLSGGGAVYHDLGNLNFTFLTRAEDFDKEKQTDVILDAVKSAGLSAEKNGRNDLTIDGRKFSGHAYYKTKEQCYHHGTVMLNVATEPLARYLNVSPLKLRAKGVKSVKSRVINLCELKPDLTVSQMAEHLTESFGKIYGLPISYLNESDFEKEVAEYEARYASPEWKYGDSDVLEHSVEEKFDWGQVRIDYNCENNILTKVIFYTDGLDADYFSQTAQKLTGCPIKTDAIISRLSENETEKIFASDIASLFRRQKNEI